MFHIETYANNCTLKLALKVDAEWLGYANAGIEFDDGETLNAGRNEAGISPGFTASTSFANPAVTIARSLSDTFGGIAPSSAPRALLASHPG